MLGKLLKHDLKSIFKVLIIFYTLAVVFGILTRIFLSFKNSLVVEVIGETKMVVTVFEPCDNFEPCDDFENEINEDFLNETS